MKKHIPEHKQHKLLGGGRKSLHSYVFEAENNYDNNFVNSNVLLTIRSHDVAHGERLGKHVYSPIGL